MSTCRIASLGETPRLTLASRSTTSRVTGRLVWERIAAATSASGSPSASTTIGRSPRRTPSAVGSGRQSGGRGQRDRAERSRRGQGDRARGCRGEITVGDPRGDNHVRFLTWGRRFEAPKARRHRCCRRILAPGPSGARPTRGFLSRREGLWLFRAGEGVTTVNEQPTEHGKHGDGPSPPPESSDRRRSAALQRVRTTALGGTRLRRGRGSSLCCVCGGCSGTP